jgi:hypothetical protein
MLQGIDLSASDDVVAGVLMDLARVETAPRADALADGLVAAIGEAGLRLHRRPRGEAGFTVLRAADIPSVLLEIGFMSDEGDLENILDATWRAGCRRPSSPAFSTGPIPTPCARRCCASSRWFFQASDPLHTLRASQTEWPASSASSGRNQTSVRTRSPQQRAVFRRRERGMVDRRSADLPPGFSGIRPAGEEKRGTRRGMGGKDREHGALVGRGRGGRRS